MPVKKPIVNYQEKWKEQKLSVANLVLDTKNIRLGTVHSTPDEIINDLFMNEAAMTILESIAKNGFFPDEPPVVMKEDAKFVVLEGNRRAVSLKAMISPKIAPPKYVSKIEKIMESRLPIESIRVHVAPSREAAMEYLAAKHTKTTRKPWSTLRRAYFYYAQKEQGVSVEKLIERYDGVNIPSYIKMYEMHKVAISLKSLPDEVRKKVSNTAKFNISTLERFYNDKHVQRELGITFDKKTGEASVPASVSFDKVFSRVISDIEADIATSRKELSDPGARKKYTDSVVKETLNGGKVDTGTKKAATAFKPQKKAKSKKETLFIAPLECSFDSAGITRRLHELELIDYKKLPNATVDLLRSFLEVVLKEFLDKRGKTPPASKTYVYLASVLNATRKELEDVSNNKLVQVVDSIKSTKWFMDSINHNPDVFAYPDRAKDLADQMYPLVNFVFEDYAKKLKAAKK